MQKIIPCLTFDKYAEQAVNFYITLFRNSKVINKTHYTEDDLKELSRLPEDIQPGPVGNVKTIAFELNGQEFIAVNGGPYFRFTPSFSFFVTCETEAEIDRLYKSFAEGGQELMALDKYPFSDKFGWLVDKYGMSWQFNLTYTPLKITPFLMFVGDKYGKAEEALKFYTSLFKNSGIDSLEYYGKDNPAEEGKVIHAEFHIGGADLMAMESGLQHNFNFTEALSLYVNCDTQEEVDYLWDTLSEGGEKQECGWLKDEYGVSWQIAPSIAWKMVNDPDPVKSQRVANAILKMKKLEFDTIQKAYGS